MQEIKVTVVEFGDRKHYQMQYRDPITLRKVTKSNGPARKTAIAEAHRAAGKWQSELREGRYHASGKITWDEFRDHCEKEVLASLADGTAGRVAGEFNTIEAQLNPQRLRNVTADRLSFYQSKLREAVR